MTAVSGDRPAVLACDGCGEPLAIGDAAWVLCPACSKRVVVPEAYRELRAAELEKAAARVQIERFYRQLVRGRSLARWLVRRLGMKRAVVVYVTLLVTLLISPAVVLLAAWWLFALEPRVNVYQVLDPAVRGFAYGGAVCFAIAVPAVGFWMLGWNRSLRRESLTAALVAGKPKREGGPPTCRACGAPLSRSPGACGVACLYCGAENLIAARGDVVASAQERVLALDDVIAEEAWQRRKIRQGLVIALLVCATAGLMAMIVMWVLAGNAYGWEFEGSLTCRERVCTEWHAGRLGRDEALHVDMQGTASGPPKLRLEGQSITPFPRAWSTVAEATIDDLGQATLVAPWEGWFRVVVEVPGPAAARFGTRTATPSRPSK